MIEVYSYTWVHFETNKKIIHNDLKIHALKTNMLPSDEAYLSLW